MRPFFRHRETILAAALSIVCTAPVTVSAFLIENKSEYPARVEIKDDRFRTIETVRIDANGSYEFVDPERAEEFFNIEAYIEDPADVLGTPTFLHEVRYKDKVCVPVDVCTEEDHKEKKRKNRGGGFKIF